MFLGLGGWNFAQSDYVVEIPKRAKNTCNGFIREAPEAREINTDTMRSTLPILLPDRRI